MLLERLFPVRSEQASNPAPWDDFWYNPVGGKTASGVDVNPSIAFTYSAVWACTRLLCGSGSHLPFNLCRKLPKGGKEVATEHKVHDLIHNAPNGEMSSMSWRALGMNHQINWGGSFNEIERSGLGVEALWPIHASRVLAPKRINGKLVYDVRQDDGTHYRLPAEDMLHIPSIITEDGISGKGVVSQARESIGFGLAVEQSGAAYLGNGSRFSVIIKHPGKFSKEARINFRRDWDEIHAGPRKSGKMALLQEGADAMQVSHNARDAQFLESRQFGIDEIARWYGVPPHMIQHLMKPTYASVEVQSIEFVVYSLLPWLRLWEFEVNRKLLTKEEQKTYYAKHVLDSLLRGDTATRIEALVKQINNGLLSLDEARDIEDRNPIEDDLGANHFMPVNIQTIDKAVSNTPAATVADPIGDAEDPDDTGSEDLPNKDQAENLEPDYKSTLSSVLVQNEAMRRELTELRESQERSNRLALNAATSGLLRKEMNEVRTIAKKPAEFLRRVDEFYENFGRLFTEVVTPYASNAQELAQAHVAQSKAELLVAAECKPVELADAVERLLIKWKERGK